MAFGVRMTAFVATILINIMTAIGASSVLYWLNDRTIHPLAARHRKGLIQIAGFSYIAVLYAFQALQFQIDPALYASGSHWVYLNMMLVSLFFIAVESGGWLEVVVWMACTGAYILRYAFDLTPALITAYLVWSVSLVVLERQREIIKRSRRNFYGSMLLFGITGFAVIYLMYPRHFDDWFLVRQLVSFVILGGVVGQYSFLAVAVDKQQALLQRIADYDNMTNASVFAHDQDDMSRLLSLAHASNQPMVLAALDVDYLGQFNQRYGHLSGNAVLVQIASVLKENLRKSGTRPHIYRNGGEEFTVVFLGAEPEKVAGIVDECLRVVRQNAFEVGDETAHLTLSAGLTTVQRTDEMIDTVYKRADDNLNLSKQRGRDVLTLNGRTYRAATEAVAEQLAFFAQPINQTAAGEAHPWAKELLLRRYDQTEARWVLPERFDLPVEQQIALIREMLRHDSLRKVTVNLTLAQFSDPNTARALAGFARADYGPEKMAVEITAVPDLGTMRRVTALYRNAGIAVFIDDVGSDNSYELVRKLLPYVDGVKFAMQNLRRHEDDVQIHERVLFWAEVAHKQRIEFILEGVETAADVAFAENAGIHHFQGYYYAKPELPAA